MKIENFGGRAVCFCCKQKFDNGFEIDFDKRFFNNFKFCKNCCENMYEQLASKLVPKSPKNIFNINIKDRRERWKKIIKKIWLKK